MVKNAIPDQKLAVYSAYEYTFAADTFYDGNSDTMTYSVSGNPSWLLLDSGTRLIDNL